MTTPNDPMRNDDLEARLRATFDRDVARAGEDLAATDLVSAPLAAGRRRSHRQMTTGALAGVAAVLLIGVALIVGSGGRRDPVEPPVSPAAVVPTPYESGSPVPGGSPTPLTSQGPGEGIPFIDPGVPFPATVDGRPVVSVGPAADAALAAATDDSPIYVSGWWIGTDRHGCPGFDLGSPAPNGVMWTECSALALRATVDGGATLPVYLNYANLDANLRGPEGTMAMEVLLRVHTHDAGCADDDCLHKPVHDAVVQYRVPRLAPAVLAASMPPGGVTMAEAIATADAYLANNPSLYSASWVLLRAELGSRLVIGENGEEPDGDWAWAIWYVSEDGYFETTVYVDFRSGTANHSSGGSLRFP